MDHIRAFSLDERKKYYTAHRLNDQRTWYMRKAGENNRSARNWVIASVVAYVLAFALVLARIKFPDWEVLGDRSDYRLRVLRTWMDAGQEV